MKIDMKNNAIARGLSVFLMCMALSPAAIAQDNGDSGYAYEPVNAAETSQIALSVGAFDVFGDEDSAIDFRAEYRPAKGILSDNLKPWGGLEITSEGSLWAGGGVLYDYAVSPEIALIPSFGAGLYDEGGSDLDLGHPLQFRTQLEIARTFNNGHAVSASLSHMSNFGLDDEDPGAETLGVYWYVPFGTIF